MARTALATRLNGILADDQHDDPPATLLAFDAHRYRYRRLASAWLGLQVNWLVWPVLTGFNLAVVPLPYRILFVNGCSLFWSAFLSNMANNSKAAAPAVAATATTSTPKLQ